MVLRVTDTGDTCDAGDNGDGSDLILAGTGWSRLLPGSITWLGRFRVKIVAFFPIAAVPS